MLSHFDKVHLLREAAALGPLTSMKKAELVELAKLLKIKTANLNKAELIEKIIGPPKSRTTLEHMKKADLAAYARLRGVSDQGTKADIIKRLRPKSFFARVLW